MLYYTTVNRFKQYLNIDDNSKDQELERVIVNATNLLDNELWWNIWLRKFRVVMDSVWRKKYFFNRKIKELINVKFNNIYAEVESYNSHYVYLKDTFPRSRNSLEFTFISWFEKTPPDLEEFFLYYCKQIWDRNKKWNVKSKKIGDLSVTYFSPQENENFILLHTWKALLKKYKLFNYCIV